MNPNSRKQPSRRDILRAAANGFAMLPMAHLLHRSITLASLLLVIASASGQQLSYSDLGDARLKELIETALENNPGVRRSFGEYQAALQRIPQVTTLPDPMLGITQFARSPETRVGPQNTMLSISQRFPWFGKLSDRGKTSFAKIQVI